MRVKTHMGLERFEVDIIFRLIYQSLGINEGIGFKAKRSFAVFFRASSTPISKNYFLRLKTDPYTFILAF